MLFQSPPRPATGSLRGTPISDILRYHRHELHGENSVVCWRDGCWLIQFANKGQIFCYSRDFSFFILTLAF